VAVPGRSTVSVALSMMLPVGSERPGRLKEKPTVEVLLVVT
jgi:hypothetical protein